MILMICLLLWWIIWYIVSDEYYKWEWTFWWVAVWIIIWLLSSAFLLNNTYEAITNTTPIVSLNDGSYNKINWWWFIFMHINSEDKTVYRYTMKIWEDEYKQYSLEWDVSIKEIKGITTGVIYTIWQKTKEVQRYTPEWMLNNLSITKYQIVIPKWSVIQEFTVDNQ